MCLSVCVCVYQGKMGDGKALDSEVAIVLAVLAGRYLFLTLSRTEGGSSSWEQVPIPAGDGAAMLLPPPHLDPFAQVQLLTWLLYWFCDAVQGKCMTPELQFPHPIKWRQRSNRRDAQR